MLINSEKLNPQTWLYISCPVVLEPHFGGAWVCLLTTRSLVVSIWLFWLTPIDKLFEVRDQDHSRKAASKISLPRVCALRLPEWGPKEGPLLDDPPAGCSDVGQRDDVGPFFGRISLIRTPPGGDRFTYRREIIHSWCFFEVRSLKNITEISTFLDLLHKSRRRRVIRCGREHQVPRHDTSWSHK